MVKKDKFNKTIESLREKIVAIRASLLNMKNEVNQASQQSISLTNRIKTIQILFESSDIIEKWDNIAGEVT